MHEHCASECLVPVEAEEDTGEGGEGGCPASALNGCTSSLAPACSFEQTELSAACESSYHPVIPPTPLCDSRFLEVINSHSHAKPWTLKLVDNKNLLNNFMALGHLAGLYVTHFTSLEHHICLSSLSTCSSGPSDMK